MHQPPQTGNAMKTIKNFGKIHFEDNITDGQGMRISRDFGKSLMSKFAQHSKKMFEATGDVPYVYRERQISSSILMSISSFADAVFAEAPTRRHKKESEGHGWIDYWAVYKKTTFVIEVKHGYSSIRDPRIRKDVKSKWQEAHNQLEAVKKNTYGEMRFDKGIVVKTPLLFVTHFVSTSKEENEFSAPAPEQLITRHNAISKSLTPCPNWSGILIPKDADMIGPYEYKSGREYFPAVGFFMNFSGVDLD